MILFYTDQVTVSTQNMIMSSSSRIFITLSFRSGLRCLKWRGFLLLRLKLVESRMPDTPSDQHLKAARLKLQVSFGVYAGDALRRTDLPGPVGMFYVAQR